MRWTRTPPWPCQGPSARVRVAASGVGWARGRPPRFTATGRAVTAEREKACVAISSLVLTQEGDTVERAALSPLHRVRMDPADACCGASSYQCGFDSKRLRACRHDRDPASPRPGAKPCAPPGEARADALSTAGRRCGNYREAFTHGARHEDTDREHRAAPPPAPPAGDALGRGRARPGPRRADRPAGRGLPWTTTPPSSDWSLADVVGPGRPDVASLADLAAVGFKAVHAVSLGGARLVDEAVLAAMGGVRIRRPRPQPP